MLFAFLAAAVVDTDALDEKFKVTLNAYQACVRDKGTEFERAGESINETIDAAFAACATQKGNLWLAMLDAQAVHQAKMSDAERQKNRDVVFGVVEEQLRKELLADLMQKRADRR